MDTELISQISESPLMFLLYLPDGCKSGREGAAETFAKSLQEIKDAYPEERFQLVPHLYLTAGGNDPGLAVLMAIAM